MSLSTEMAVFADTSIGTRIAMAVSPNITAANFKRELERAHFNCFPGLGEITVNGLTVKRKSCFYHLPESMPVKYAFQGLKGNWFIHAEASSLCTSDRPGLSGSLAADVTNPLCTSDRPGLSGSLAADVTNHNFNCGSVDDSLKAENYKKSADKKNMKRKEKKMQIKRCPCLKLVVHGLVRNDSSLSKKKKIIKNKQFLDGAAAHETGYGFVDRSEESEAATNKEHEVEPREKQDSSRVMETVSERSSEVISVTGIIKSYFPNSEEVSPLDSPSKSEVNSRVIQNGQKSLKHKKDDTLVQVNATPEFTTRTPQRMLTYQFRQNSISGRLRSKSKKPKVWERLLMASNNLGISSSKQRPPISACRSRNGKLPGSHSSSLVRSLVFEISDSED